MQILFLVLIVIAIFTIFSKKRKPGNTVHNMKTAEMRLNERFVNGEIDEETFKKMKEVIK